MQHVHCPHQTGSNNNKQASWACRFFTARYEDAIVTLKSKVKESEGEDMREAIQDKVRKCAVGISSASSSSSTNSVHGISSMISAPDTLLLSR